MELKNRNFAIFLFNEFNDEKSIKGITHKISLRKQVHFNRLNLENKKSYILYEPDKVYLFNMASNKRLKLIWKSGEKIEGDIEYLNINKKFRHLNKVQLVGGQMLDEKEPHLYEHFVIYIKD